MPIRGLATVLLHTGRSPAERSNILLVTMGAARAGSHGACGARPGGPGSLGVPGGVPNAAPVVAMCVRPGLVG